MNLPNTLRCRRLVLLACLLLRCACGMAQEYGGSLPLMWADFPDPDVIRVGEYYYMVTTTMHYMPGAPIMRSRDLQHWQTVSHVFHRLEDTPAYDLLGGTKYGQGQWATSLRYHDGHFYALFVTNGVPGTWIYETTDPTGNWHLHAHLRGFYHDASLFFDDADGRVYVFSGSGSVDITELQPDLRAEKPNGFRRHLEVRDAEEHGLLEGSRVVKHNGYYYLLMISWPRTGRRQLAYRARTLDGPWEKRVILESDFDGCGKVGQGTIVDGPDGRWHGIIFQDRTAVGRILTLSPCRWVDDWPMLGDDDGRVTPCARQATVDTDLQWNHNPDTTLYRLDARRHTIRLRTRRLAPNIFMAPNTLTWRMWGPQCADTVQVDLTQLQEGDVTGFAALNGDAALLSVRRCGGRLLLSHTEESVQLDGQKRVTACHTRPQGEADITGKRRLWLAIQADLRPHTDMATMLYSTDGRHFRPLGPPFHMRFDYRRFFTGTRFAVFYYSTRTPGGEVTFRLPPHTTRHTFI